MNNPNKNKIEFYPQNTLEKLGFEDVKKLILKSCISTLGKEAVENIYVSINADTINVLLAEVNDFNYINYKNLNFPILDYLDIREYLKIIKVENSYIETKELYNILLVLNIVERILKFIIKNKDGIPNLFKIIENVEFISSVKEKIKNVLEDESTIKSNASAKLNELRSEITKKEKQIITKFNKVLSSCKKNDWLSEDSESIRKGERVLSVKSKYKRKIKGLIFDVSTSGQTTFLVPESVVELRNDLFNLKQEEKREIVKILKEVANVIRPYIDDILNYQKMLGQFDLIRAKSLFGKTINGNIPKVKIENGTKLTDAYHPLLLLKNKIKGLKTVPLSISLKNGTRITVISGPNAGGKSVCLKTIGLTQLMFQAGIPIPADPNSEIGVFSKLFVDIGDEQSIDNDLSTYSSHLHNMNYFLHNSDENTLFLFDEFGAGTDPQIGGIIAESILENLNNRKGYGVVTTHYSNLKLFASETQALQNAAMRFDVEKMIPIYELELGEPGSSFAYEIIQNIGFPKNLLQNLKTKIIDQHLSLDKLIISLQKDKKKIDKKLSEIQTKENETNKLLNFNKELKQELQEKKLKIIADARIKANLYLDNVNRRFEKIIKELSQKNKGEKKTNLKEIKDKIYQEKKNIDSVLKKQKGKKRKKTLLVAVTIGAEVRIQGSNETG
ncbi:MAG: hypothetical protein U9R42_00890, partial [Bacteroidota bacterium]|nr:hypothetical protein [Bacteroidota bacterium]